MSLAKKMPKESWAVAVYNHYKRLLQKGKTQDDIEIEKSNVIMVGETGTGKTFWLDQLLSC